MVKSVSEGRSIVIRIAVERLLNDKNKRWEGLHPSTEILRKPPS